MAPATPFASKEDAEPMNRRSLLALSAVTVLAAGCASPFDSPDQTRFALEAILEENTRAANVLAGVVRKSLGNLPVMVTTVVSLDRLNESSSLGRMISEHVAAGMVKAGVPVVEVRMREALFVRTTQGELMLSREVQELSQMHRAHYVVGGTYTVSGPMLFVTLKIVRPADNVVVGAHTYSMPMGPFRHSGL